MVRDGLFRMTMAETLKQWRRWCAAYFRSSNPAFESSSPITSYFPSEPLDGYVMESVDNQIYMCKDEIIVTDLIKLKIRELTHNYMRVQVIFITEPLTYYINPNYPISLFKIKDVYNTQTVWSVDPNDLLDRGSILLSNIENKWHIEIID